MIGPNQHLSAGEARQARTADPAFALRRERDIGSIKAGKLADLVVLDRDLAGLPPTDIPGVPVQMTVVGGAIVYQAGG